MIFQSYVSLPEGMPMHDIDPRFMIAQGNIAIENGLFILVSFPIKKGDFPKLC